MRIEENDVFILVEFYEVGSAVNDAFSLSILFVKSLVAVRKIDCASLLKLVRESSSTQIFEVSGEAAIG